MKVPRFMTVVLAAATLLGVAQAAPAQQRKPLDLVLALDVSGSMKKNDPQGLMSETISHFISQLGLEDAVGLVLFGGQALPVHPLAPLSMAEQREALLAQTAEIRYGEANTNIAAAVERGLYELKSRGRTDSAQAIIVATDGIMDTGSAARDEEMKRWLREQLLPEARDRKVRLFSIAFTETADYTLLQEMARVTGGGYFRAMSADEIGKIFQELSTSLRRAPEAVPEEPSAAPPPKLRGNLPLWMGGGAVALVALSIFAVFFWRSIRTRSATGQSPAEKTSELGPLPPAELLDIETRDDIRLNKAVMRVGRDLDNDVLITAPTVSGHHAQIEYQRGQFYLKDLRSLNGTFVNQQRVEGEVLLKTGDIIRFDKFRYTFLGPEPMAGGTMVREAPLEASGETGRRRKTLILEAAAVTREIEEKQKGGES